MVSEWRGSLTQNRRKTRPLKFCMILVVYLSPGILQPVVAVLLFLQIQFFGEVLSSQNEEPQKKGGASLSQHASFCRSGCTYFFQTLFIFTGEDPHFTHNSTLTNLILCT